MVVKGKEVCEQLVQRCFYLPFETSTGRQYIAELVELLLLICTVHVDLPVGYRALLTLALAK